MQVGTLGYIAPEVKTGTDYNELADIYSLGITAHSCTFTSCASAGYGGAIYVWLTQTRPTFTLTSLSFCSNVASLGGTTELGGYNFQPSTDNTILEGAFPDLTRIEKYQNAVFFGCGLSGAAKLGKRATTINYRLFGGSINLTGFYIPGHDDVPSGSTQTRTLVEVKY